jgi:phage tail sheath protein FI
MASLTSSLAPGVYTNEQDFSDYIANSGSTRVGLVGTARRGPLNTPVFCSTTDQFIQAFGTPVVGMHAMYAAINYLRKGNSLWFQRVANQFALATTVNGSVTKGQTTSITVLNNTGIANGSYVLIQQPGKLSTFAQVATTTSTTGVTLTTPTADSYSVGASVLVSGASVGTVSAEAIAPDYNFDKALVMSANSGGSWANYGSRAGLEVVIEDGGNFSNIDPTTNLPFANTDGISLQGVMPSAPSVNTVTELYALPTTAIALGQTRGVNDCTRGGTPQVETGTVVAASGATSSGNLPVTVTSAAIAGSPVTVNVALVGDSSDNTAAKVAVKIAAALNLNANIAVKFVATSSGANVILTARSNAANDSTLNMAWTGVLGVTALVSSTDTTAGVAATSTGGSLVWQCTDPTARTWVPIGVHTKRVRVLYAGRQVEVFDNIVSYAGPNFWETVIGTTDAPVSNYINVSYVAANGIHPSNTYSKASFPTNSRILLGLQSTNGSVTWSPVAGQDGGTVSAAGYIGTVAGQGSTGLQTFRRVEQFDINLLAVPGIYDASVIQELLSVVNDRQDAVGIVDPPIGLTPQQVVDWHNGQGAYSGDHSAFVSSYGALYYPWLQQSDPYSGRDIWLPPSAFQLAVFANSDAVGEQWYAAAGITRGSINAIKAEYTVTQGEIGLMYGPGNGNAVNAIAVFPQDGIVTWGNRTLQRTPSALDRINVRRLLIYIEKNFATSARRIVFEQDDEILWAQLRNLVNPFMDNLKGRRAVSWYKFICDASTNTSADLNNNEVVSVLELIPTKSAERIRLNLALYPSGASVTESVLALG